jgi:hypothetical protein
VVLATSTVSVAGLCLSFIAGELAQEVPVQDHRHLDIRQAQASLDLVAT